MASKKISRLTEGVISRITDFTLASIFYGLELGLQQAVSMRGVERAAVETEKALQELNYKVIKRAIRELRRKGLVRTARRAFMETEITAAGRKRLQALIPKYHKRRPWDKTLYLVSYDIPVGQNHDRDLLREFLKKIGCGLLQESIWITPYNPTKLIKEFIAERSLQGTILVSVLGKDGSIGDMTLEELIEEVYHLSDLNSKYNEFLTQCKHKASKQQLVFTYLSILVDDPQLPFELLPEDWLGDKAHEKFVQLNSLNRVH